MGLIVADTRNSTTPVIQGVAWHCSIFVDGTLYAAGRNCDSMSAQATHNQTNARAPTKMQSLHTNEGNMHMPTVDIGAEYGAVHLESQPQDHIRDHIVAFLAAHAGAGVHV